MQSEARTAPRRARRGRRPQGDGGDELRTLLAGIRACRICAPELPHAPRPVIRASAKARVLIAGQAPGRLVHETGIPFNDPSGERLRAWMGVTREEFYDETKIAIVPMGFCFPGYNARGADKPPIPVCARTWRKRVMALLPQIRLVLLVGGYAQKWHIGTENLTDTVASWRAYGPRYIPLPHPSWRNNAWLKRHPWFEAELLPYLRARVRRLLSC